MSKLLQASQVGTGRTLNGAVTNKSSLDPVVDLFSIAGSSRGKDLIPQLKLALNQDKDLTGRLVLWMRDILEGAGERGQFLNFMNYLARTDVDIARRIMKKIPVDGIGRWDDVLVFVGTPLQDEAVQMIVEALRNGDALCAKWMPRRQKDRQDNNALVSLLAKALNPEARPYAYQEKLYRKTLSSLSKTVEQQMCAKEWDKINYSHVPSKAAVIYRSAFYKHSADRYQEWLDKLTKGDTSVKVSAKTLYPYEVMKQVLDFSRNEPISWRITTSKTTIALAEAQWKALPNFVGDSSEKILPMIDVSASMGALIPKTQVSFMDISVSLGMYFADRNKGEFAGEVITFTDTPTFFKFPGGIEANLKALRGIPVGYSTNVEAAFRLILHTAIAKGLSNEDLPTKVLLISDMEFNSSSVRGKSPYQTMKAEFEKAGYNIPQVVFWNVNARVGNTPATVANAGTALVSGFSPSILTAIMKGCDTMNPQSVMLEKLMSERYSF